MGMTIDPKTKSLKLADNQVKDIVSVHEKTVQEVAKKSTRPRRSSKKSQPKRQKAQPPVVTTYKKCPDWCDKNAWREAILLAEGNYKRLTIENATTILVKNQ